MTPGVAQFGPYNLLYPLGAGGMGQVFLARQTGENEIHRLVAIKRILAHLSGKKDLVNLFLDEVRVAAQLNHGNIVQVIDHGSIDNQYYMAMEYVHGENMMELLLRLAENKSRIPLPILLHIVGSVCAGLEYAHTKESINGNPLEIVHRDISPQNIFLSFQGEVKIGDFGVARAAEQTHQTVGGELRGKISYMSPEQAFGRQLDHRSDLFSTGVVLYEALAGRNPFLRDNPMATLEAVRAAQIVSLKVIHPELPAEIVDLVHQSLKYDPDDRPSSARAMYEALQKTIANNELGATSFDLADYMVEIFPEARKQSDQNGPDRTVAGRRADQIAHDEDSSIEAKPQKMMAETLYYLTKRRPEGMTHASEWLLNDPMASELSSDLNWKAIGQDPAKNAPDDLQNKLKQNGKAKKAIEKTSAREPSPAEKTQPPKTRFFTIRFLAIFLVLAGAVAGGVTLNFFSPKTNSVTENDIATSKDMQKTTQSKTPDLSRKRPIPDSTVTIDGEAEPTRVSKKQTGTLSVASVPESAWVSVNSRRVGTTPFKKVLPVGTYKIGVGNRGYKTTVRPIRITKDKSSKIKWTLTPLSTTINVTSTHRCRVLVGGIELGHTPLTKPVKPGPLAIKCVNGALKIAAIKKTRATVGEINHVKFLFGALAVRLDPWATVSVNGKSYGTTPLKIILPAGEHHIVLKNKEANRSTRTAVEIRPGKTARISAW